MEGKVTIFCKNNSQYYEIPFGTSLRYPVVAAHVNYKVQNLNFLVYKPKDIEFIDYSNPDGKRCYVRTLIMTIACAIKELWPDTDLRIEHPISKGYFCTLRNADGSKKEITAETLFAIRR